MISTRKILPFLLGMALVYSCQPPVDNDESVHGIQMSNMDTTTNPSEDFYQFANGQWLENTVIPEDEGRYGGFTELRDVTDADVLKILEAAAKSDKYTAGTDQRKVADFYAIGMDTALAEKAGINPLKPFHEKVEAISNVAELQTVMAELGMYGFNNFFGAGVFGDLKDSDMNALYIAQSGLGLPNKDYYTKMDERSVEIRDKYILHIERMLKLSSFDDDDFAAKAKLVFDLENRLAAASLTPIEQRNIPLLYNKMGIDGLTDLTPSIDWNRFFTESAIKEVDTMIVMVPKFMQECERIFTDTDPESWKWYLKWHIINKAAGYLNKEVDDANFDFYGKELRGTEEMKPRWERVLGQTNGALGEALGQLYVDESFPPEAKAAALEMVNNLKEAFETRINNLEWMSDSTKIQAQAKLKSFTVKIGYPDKWKDYSDLEVETTGETYSYFNNRLNSDKFQHYEAVNKIGKPVDKEEWAMSPQTVNAYYNPLNNEIVFPAAILQPPFYDYKADPAVNYGGIGAVIGHEISHGFDDQGSRFDAEGNMVNWWSESDSEKFSERTQMLVDQFDAYEALDSVFVQGRLTLGENIGDLGGLSASYDALQIHFAKNGKPDPIDGFSQEQRFFLSWATIWRTKYRDESLRNQIQTDPHSPAMYRATGPLVNFDPFYEAFSIKEGDPMWKADSARVRIW